ncbi:hypothetical protein [Leuconostoc citreum]|uniref:hypothetical protein n=1 Tax=Leuconostoc citreum TaxID=33964 RepID=UPI0032E00239
MDNLATNDFQLRNFTLDDENLLSTDIELIKWFDKKPWLKGLVTEENYQAPSEYMSKEYHQVERTFKRYYE